MMTNDKATPRLWKLKGSTVTINGKNVLRVCRDNSASELEAVHELRRAEYCVNSHDALLNACKRAEFALEYILPLLQKELQYTKNCLEYILPSLQAESVFKGEKTESVTHATIAGNLAKIKQAIAQAEGGCK